jgi:hypothetical protein
MPMVSFDCVQADVGIVLHGCSNRVRSTIADLPENEFALLAAINPVLRERFSQTDQTFETAAPSNCFVHGQAKSAQRHQALKPKYVPLKPVQYSNKRLQDGEIPPARLRCFNMSPSWSQEKHT